jgi:hypothetical protein
VWLYAEIKTLGDIPTPPTANADTGNGTQARIERDANHCHFGQTIDMIRVTSPIRNPGG